MANVKFNNVFFDQLLRSAGIAKLTKEAAEKVLTIAKANAPVDTGAYKNNLEVVEPVRNGRRVFLVKGNDKKTLLIEAKTGNLLRALKQVSSGNK